MFRLIGWVMGAAFALAGWRNLPPLSQPHAEAAGFLIGGCVVLAYYAGTRRKRDAAVTVAVAKAEARALAAVQATTTSQAVNQVRIEFPGRGARVMGEGLGLDEAPWMVGAHRSIELDDTEAFDTAMADVMEEREEQW